MSLNGRVYDVQQGALKVRKTFTVSTLALAIFVLVNPAQAAETGSGTTGTANTAASGSQQDMVIEGSATAAASDGQDYAVKTTTAGTKMNLTPRDIPQSVSVITKQRMQDQDLQSVGDVLNNTTGISTEVIDSERVS